ncbi:uncharacterized protein LOC143425510 [Xylocopa sonorina]|uniref:uncharacterized protein LOC143425510 n=1 Tax=Xylocopa sonorina TaxID=1818115 RepID=UPI00403B13FC
MRRCLLLILCAAGISAMVVQPFNISSNSEAANRPRIGRRNGPIKRYACPVGFFRLKRYCYYLSGGMAPWREAYFHCKDRNATLAVLDRNGKDRMLRKYLSSDQFTKLERWIGGIFNWQQMDWEWGVTSQKMVFQNFGLPQSNHSKQQYEWHCVTIDPKLKYRWSPRSCIQRKHYVCEALAGRIGRRRKKTADPLAPQNQRLKPRKKGKKYEQGLRKPNKQNKQRGMWRKNFAQQNADYWAHGVISGSRPPTKAMYPKTRMRHHSNRTQPNSLRVAQTVPREQEYSAFLGDGPSNGPQSLTDVNQVFPQIKINDLVNEEVLIRP